ncbi:DE-cadherin-like isoform X2 [Mercenaria mercenaria]|uniref:DE-cadherin-like isoform X2 n=1 Tax=Mercenaria mercenaria TaxID=6596 RepID=UPI00234F95EF|nr:DE-cadherin-like isoform X2 [Mercenaria mercenaria]XP_053407262.1 DE-cadherin-like isoform X2 [Mercenaria mercenaria]XP_053407263.1 DE-cadherin-like isoform X2 [Mercenaria mercenaria]
MFREVSLLFMLSLLDVGQGTWQDPAEEGDAKNIYICESFPPGETVMTLLTDTEATFHIHTDSTGALEMFEIIGNELKIKDTITEDQLDYEGDSPFRNIEITLVATDKDTSGEVSIDCTIYNEDDNDNEPVFKGSPPYTKSIRDTPSAGDFVYQVEATDADGSSDNNQITYSFKDEYPIFKIDANSGTISLTDSVADSPLERGNEYQLIVIGTDSNPETPLSSEVNLTVRVGSPVTWTDPAEGDAQNIYMCESFTAGEVLMELLAEDPDEDKLTFTIDPASEEALKYFEIVDGNKLAIKSDVNMSNLDYEGEKNFREVGITLLVSDDVYDPVPIDCKIINEDSNDNPPVFAPEPPYTQTIRESLSVGGSVFQAEATDNDGTSPNNQLSYSLEGGDGKFSIDADGLITLADGAVIAEGETYTLTIAATDNNPDEPLSAEAVLTVTVEAKAAPQFVFPDPDDVDECKIYICESAQADEVFLTFAATDEDTDDETLTYNIDQSEESVKALFEVDGKNLKIRTEISENYFDYEAESPTLEYPISIEVSDGSTSTQLETKVCVEDWNDNAPEFEGDFTKTIIDATAGGDAVLVVTATDKDGTPENNQVTLTMEDSDTFNFDSGTKTISVKDGVTFDVDTKSEYTVTIVAEDSALEDTLTTRQTYTINIGTAPVFQNPDPEDKDECKLYIRELTQVDETFATLAATDKTPPNGEFTFSMDKSSDDVKALFKIEGNELKVKSSEADFDYEKKDVVLQYTIQLMVSDGMFSSEMTATICVEDDNDHAPVFEDTDYKASILEEAPAGTTLLTVSATDDDGTPAYNQVTYSLSGTGSENFKINPSTGIITLAADSSLDFTTTPKYTLTVTASDNVPDDEKTATKEVKIDILTGPKIENLQSPKTVSIDENVDDKYIISTLDVLDEDDVGSVSVSIETE